MSSKVVWPNVEPEIFEEMMLMAQDPEIVASIERMAKGFSSFAGSAPLDPAPYEPYKVSVPEGRRGPWAIERFEVSEEASRMDQLRAALNSHRWDRAVAPGVYTRLVHESRGTVMSDTRSEIEEHREALEKIESWEGCKKVLIHGLGIGLILQAAIKAPHVREIDVVEIDPDVIQLVAPHYYEMAYKAGKLLWIHRGDAYAFRFAPGRRWDLAWHDVWDHISSANLPQMSKLKRRYGSRVEWQGCWAEDQCRAGSKQAKGEEGK